MIRTVISDLGAEVVFEHVLKDEDSFLISPQVSHLDSVQSVLTIKLNVFQVLHFSWFFHPALGLFTCLPHFKEAFLSPGTGGPTQIIMRCIWMQWC